MSLFGKQSFITVAIQSPVFVFGKDYKNTPIYLRNLHRYYLNVFYKNDLSSYLSKTFLTRTKRSAAVYSYQ